MAPHFAPACREGVYVILVGRNSPGVVVIVYASKFEAWRLLWVYMGGVTELDGVQRHSISLEDKREYCENQGIHQYHQALASVARYHLKDGYCVPSGEYQRWHEATMRHHVRNESGPKLHG